MQIGKKAPYEYDLPGGGIEADEDEAAALMREFQEETGLTVWPTRVIGRAGQFWVNKDEPRNSLATFYEVEFSADRFRADGAGSCVGLDEPGRGAAEGDGATNPTLGRSCTGCAPAAQALLD